MRGTPQQIIDKYNQLARDSQLGNDRVATENFQQHAEHYLRMLAEAQREQAERQAQQQQQQDRQRNNPQSNQQNNPQGGPGRGDERDGQQSRGDQANPGGGDQPSAQKPISDQVDAKKTSGGPDVIDVASEDSQLVETPENRAPRPRRKKPAPAAKAPETDDQPAPPADAAE